MNDLAAFVEQGWADHAGAPQAVADRLHDGFELLRSDDDVAALARLAEHVYGSHLGQWTPGLQFLMRLSERANRRGVLQRGGDAEASIERFGAALSLCKGQRDPRPGQPPSERIRITALAASHLATFDGARAKALLAEALQAAIQAQLPDGDPMQRTLAVCGNNIAATLEELAERSDDQRALMITAAETARYYWEKAGTWANVERAAYRLAHTWLKAGDPEQARWHAASCLQIVHANGDVALESFFGHEALALVEQARGDDASAQQALARLRADFERLAAADQDGCRATLAKVERALSKVGMAQAQAAA